VKLSILIPSVPHRVKRLGNILWQLERQVEHGDTEKGEVELLVLMDNMTMSIGEKRNKLMDMAKGEYFSFVDDDDQIGFTYIDHLIKAINETGSDVITFNQVRKGFEPNNFLTTKYDIKVPGDGEWREEGGEIFWCGIPAHTSCWKKEFSSVRFPEISDKEDLDWMRRARMATESHHHIDYALYFYTIRHKPHKVEKNEFYKSSGFSPTL